jgi:UDPglucose 6-dehydrogenase
VALRLTVLGTGYLGATHAACLAALGFEVLGVDVDAERVAVLAAGELPFFEPGLGPLVERGVQSGRLRFTTSYRDAADFGQVHFICVNTPQQCDSGAADLSCLMSCVDSLAPLLTRPCLVVGKSTVPVGTADVLAERLARVAPAGQNVELAWNPEFLREGYGVTDTLRPERIVIGVSTAAAEKILREVYAEPQAAGVPVVVTDYRTAELVKVAANAFLATKISFINAMAEVCDATGADVTMLADALGYDHRIGAAGMRPGVGFGGSCLPKDIRAFAAWAGQEGAADAIALMHDVDVINLRQRTRVIDLACSLVGGSVSGRQVAVLGLAFKPDSDDIRDSPALDVAVTLHRMGANLTAYDPVAMDRARKAHPQLNCAPSAVSAVSNAEVVLVLTEWQEFRQADPHALGKAAAKRNVVDGRHALDPALWRDAGWTYCALGRP